MYEDEDDPEPFKDTSTLDAESLKGDPFEEDHPIVGDDDI